MYRIDQRPGSGKLIDVETRAFGLKTGNISNVVQKGRNPGLPCTFRKGVRAPSRAP